MIRLNNTTVWFTSDTHFYHENIINFCNRPYSSVEEMNESLIANWNSVVKPNDYIFHLGDFCWGNDKDKIIEILKRLNGKINLILGNHDTNIITQRLERYFHSVQYQDLIEINSDRVYVSHLPFATLPGIDSPSKQIYQCYGHVHLCPNYIGSDYKYIENLNFKQYDVGVDANNYFPVSWDMVRDKMKLFKQLNTSQYKYIVQ